MTTTIIGVDLENRLETAIEFQKIITEHGCEAKQKELTAQRDTLADRLKKLEKSKLAEQADVDRLEGHSLAAFFYQVIGKMDEKLDKERQEAYAARVKYDAAFHDLSSVDADLEQIQNRLARLSDCESQYQAALSEKIKSIKASAHPAAQQIAESESRIAALKVQKRELLEAINAGKTALHTVDEVLETLDNAEGWSTWDVMSKARWNVNSISLAAATNSAVRISSTRPSEVSIPATTQSAPQSWAKLISSSIW